MLQARISLMVLLGLAVAGAATWRSNASEDGVPGKEFRAKLQEIAASYLKYARVVEEPRWAPALCAPARPAPGPIQPQFSASKDEDAHGKKLYYLFAQERPSYVAGKTPPIGQVIVKESWAPKQLTEKEAVALTPDSEEKVTHVTLKDGKIYLASERKDLFIMFKIDPTTPNTDNGWVYGTVAPDGKTVTSAGRVESCMQCHKDAKNDRLFGLKKARE